MQKKINEILESVISLTGANFGTVQLLDSSGVLKIVSERGFSDSWLEFWSSVKCEGACGSALQNATRILVPDIRKSPIFAQKESLDIQLRENVQAVQSTPILTSEGKIVGIFSTQYKIPTEFESKRLLIIDSLVKHTADVVEFHTKKQLIHKTLQEKPKFLKATYY